jgi:putative endonuclease
MSDNAKTPPTWYVYLLRCRNGELYTGIATDVSRRVAKHREGNGAKYLRGKTPLRLVFKKAIGRKSLALKIESSIKKLSKARKESLIRDDHLIELLVSRT